MAAGLSQIRCASVFFQNDAPNPLSLGTALMGSVGFRVTPANAAIHLHVGAQHRYNTGSQDSLIYTVQATYPFIRIEMKRFFVGFGLTPFVWKRLAGTAGLNNIDRANGWYGGLFEAAYLYPITPQVLFAAVGAGEAMVLNNVFSPRPMLTGIAMLRFYIGGYRNSSEKEIPEFEREEYDGWRYPRGYPR
jgi:hypothetical protein